MNGARFGQPAPQFTLPATSQPEITLSSFKGKADVVLVFYCYDWGTI
jgi:peroxiredoxin